jgi:hypothetical protein
VGYLSQVSTQRPPRAGKTEEGLEEFTQATII